MRAFEKINKAQRMTLDTVERPSSNFKNRVNLNKSVKLEINNFGNHELLETDNVPIFSTNFEKSNQEVPRVNSKFLNSLAAGIEVSRDIEKRNSRKEKLLKEMDDKNKQLDEKLKEQEELIKKDKEELKRLEEVSRAHKPIIVYQTSLANRPLTINFDTFEDSYKQAPTSKDMLKEMEAKMKNKRIEAETKASKEMDDREKQLRLAAERERLEIYQEKENERRRKERELLLKHREAKARALLILKKTRTEEEDKKEYKH